MTMHVGRSVKVALAKQDKTQQWLADKLGVSRTRTSTIANAEDAGSPLLRRLAAAFSMKVSEFIALGEDRSNGENTNS
jgi:plasmid maintenance system antidote protein VapI